MYIFEIVPAMKVKKPAAPQAPGVRPQGGGKIAGTISLTPTAVRKRNARQQAKGGPLMHRGYPCTKDCSGHVAGDQWARNRGITNPNQCPYGNSNSFWEGCKSEAEGRK